MLLENNTKKVIDLLYQFDNLSNIDKIRLAINLLENKHFNIEFNINDIVIILKQVMEELDSNYSKVITNFNKYKHLTFFSAKYLELTEKEKMNFTIEMLFSIYETDFNNEFIDDLINNNLLVYDYSYSIINN